VITEIISIDGRSTDCQDRPMTTSFTTTICNGGRR
jgi:hypothetical protein